MKLDVVGLGKYFPGRRIFQSWSYTFEDGCYAVVGSNGMGKSTLLKILAGVESSQGEVLLNGISLAKCPLEYKQLLGYSPDRLEFYPFLTVDEFFRLVSNIKEIESIDQTNYLVQGLSISKYFTNTLESLSLGTKKKVLLIAALASDPQLLLLDEPTDELDRKSKDFILNVLKQRKSQITIISTHDQELVDVLSNEIIDLDASNG